MKKIGVLGAGSWGTALTWLLTNNGHEVTLWSIMEAEVEMLRTKREHTSKLPGVKLQESIQLTSNLEEAMADKDVLVLAVPSPYTRSTAQKMAPYLKKGQIVVNVAKGVEEHTLMTLSQIIEEELPEANVAVLSGPSHAEEVGKGLPTTCVVGARTRQIAEYLQEIFMSPVFRVYTSPDVLGIELGAALKNVIALAAGVADGLGYGDNTKAALITRGIAEISRLGIAMGAHARTFYGLSGIGDLIVTCASVHSRNRKAGYLMGKGYTMQEAMDEVKMVVEGVYSAKAALGLAEKYGVEMPIIAEVNKVLFEDKNAADAVNELMQSCLPAELGVELGDAEKECWDVQRSRARAAGAGGLFFIYLYPLDHESLHILRYPCTSEFLIQGIDRLHFHVGQFEIKNICIFRNPLRIYRLRNSRDSFLYQPPQTYLCRRFSVSFSYMNHCIFFEISPTGKRCISLYGNASFLTILVQV